MSLQLFLIDPMIRFSMKRRFRKRPHVMELRPLMAEIARRPQKIPSQIAKTEITLGGVRTEVFKSQKADERCALLYLHGGGWVAGTPANHTPLLWRLADQINVPVYAPDYRLAPEHPFPAGLEDCVSTYRALLEKNIPASSIVVGGDSAGGNLTLALALKLKQLGVPQPAALVCLSPATELLEPLPSHTRNRASDAMFDPRIFATVREVYWPNQDGANPLLSPLRGDVRGLPPTLFQASAAEMLCDDSVRMAEKMRAAGIAVTLDLWPRVFHVWQIMADVLPEARVAIHRISAFVNERLAAASEKVAA
jgi:acetyl esterase/lipase